MDAPKCKSCGERHYGLCPGIASPKVVRARSSKVEPAVHSGPDVGSSPAAPTKSPRADAEPARSDPLGRLKGTDGRGRIAGLIPATGAKSKSKGGRPLDSERHKTLTATKPWEAAGMSRRTWYRRKAEGVKK